ncbi:MAG: Ca(2+)-dependent cysteine protease [Geoglossum simile]|nr:MAG: Ca(2+)-dependent cysteine protease [Geoglossum simile]
MTAIFDSCHSGTALDLPYQYGTDGKLKPARHMRETGVAVAQGIRQAGGFRGAVAAFTQAPAIYSHRREAEEKTIKEKGSPANIIMFSAALDWQDAREGYSGGAMSDAFIKVLTRDRNQSYLTLLRGVRAELENRGYQQRPQFSCSHKMELTSPFRI